MTSITSFLVGSSSILGKLVFIEGKTSTIVVLIQCLLRLGRTVLLTSYTHSAVDNLVSKLLKVYASVTYTISFYV